MVGPVSAQILIDTDQDGLSDSWELVFGTDSTKKDSDGDKKSDYEEVMALTNPAGKGALKTKDTDQDRLNDRLELLFGTDPLHNDSDGDGFLDGVEMLSGFSPTSTDQTPLPKSIRIVLSTQKMERRLGGIVVAIYPVSTGKPGMATPVGEFKVLNKIPRAWSKSAQLWMPYWMHFSGRGHGIHELPEWPGGKKEGQNHLGMPVSHGCVRLGIGAAKEVYEWTPVGTLISVVR